LHRRRRNQRILPTTHNRCKEEVTVPEGTVEVTEGMEEVKQEVMDMDVEAMELMEVAMVEEGAEGLVA
jgi:hypothetical protein